MSTSKVYFSNLRTSFKENLFAKLERLIEGGLKTIVTQRDLVAIKLHFGEKVNTALKPEVFPSQLP